MIIVSYERYVSIIDSSKQYIIKLYTLNMLVKYIIKHAQSAWVLFAIDVEVNIVCTILLFFCSLVVQEGSFDPFSFSVPRPASYRQNLLLIAGWLGLEKGSGYYENDRRQATDQQAVFIFGTVCLLWTM